MTEKDNTINNSQSGEAEENNVTAPPAENPGAVLDGESNETETPAETNDTAPTNNPEVSVGHNEDAIPATVSVTEGSDSSETAENTSTSSPHVENVETQAEEVETSVTVQNLANEQDAANIQQQAGAADTTVPPPTSESEHDATNNGTTDAPNNNSSTVAPQNTANTQDVADVEQQVGETGADATPQNLANEQNATNAASADAINTEAAGGGAETNAATQNSETNQGEGEAQNADEAEENNTNNTTEGELGSAVVNSDELDNKANDNKNVTAPITEGDHGVPPQTSGDLHGGLIPNGVGPIMAAGSLLSGNQSMVVEEDGTNDRIGGVKRPRFTEQGEDAALKALEDHMRQKNGEGGKAVAALKHSTTVQNNINLKFEENPQNKENIMEIVGEMEKRGEQNTKDKSRIEELYESLNNKFSVIDEEMSTRKYERHQQKAEVKQCVDGIASLSQTMQRLADQLNEAEFRRANDEAQRRKRDEMREQERREASEKRKATEAKNELDRKLALEKEIRTLEEKMTEIRRKSMQDKQPEEDPKREENVGGNGRKGRRYDRKRADSREENGSDKDLSNDSDKDPSWLDRTTAELRGRRKVEKVSSEMRERLRRQKKIKEIYADGEEVNGDKSLSELIEGIIRKAKLRITKKELKIDDFLRKNDKDTRKAKKKRTREKYMPRDFNLNPLGHKHNPTPKRLVGQLRDEIINNYNADYLAELYQNEERQIVRRIIKPKSICDKDGKSLGYAEVLSPIHIQMLTRLGFGEESSLRDLIVAIIEGIPANSDEEQLRRDSLSMFEASNTETPLEALDRISQLLIDLELISDLYDRDDNGELTELLLRKLRFNQYQRREFMHFLRDEMEMMSVDAVRSFLLRDVNVNVSINELRQELQFQRTAKRDTLRDSAEYTQAIDNFTSQLIDATSLQISLSGVDVDAPRLAEEFVKLCCKGEEINYGRIERLVKEHAVAKARTIGAQAAARTREENLRMRRGEQVNEEGRDTEDGEKQEPQKEEKVRRARGHSVSSVESFATCDSREHCRRVRSADSRVGTRAESREVRRVVEKSWMRKKGEKGKGKKSGTKESRSCNFCFARGHLARMCSRLEAFKKMSESDKRKQLDLCRYCGGNNHRATLCLQRFRDEIKSGHRKEMPNAEILGKSRKREEEKKRERELRNAREANIGGGEGKDSGSSKPRSGQSRKKPPPAKKKVDRSYRTEVTEALEKARRAVDLLDDESQRVLRGATEEGENGQQDEADKKTDSDSDSASDPGSVEEDELEERIARAVEEY